MRSLKLQNGDVGGAEKQASRQNLGDSFVCGSFKQNFEVALCQVVSQPIQHHNDENQGLEQAGVFSPGCRVECDPVIEES